MGKILHCAMRNFLLMAFVAQLDSDHLKWSRLLRGFLTALRRSGELGNAPNVWKQIFDSPVHMKFVCLHRQLCDSIVLSTLGKMAEPFK